MSIVEPPVSAADVPAWDRTAEFVVVGLGIAGSSAALEAQELGVAQGHHIGDRQVVQALVTGRPAVARCNIHLVHLGRLGEFPGERVLAAATAACSTWAAARAAG